jgi:hypothetical protein
MKKRQLPNTSLQKDKHEKLFFFFFVSFFSVFPIPQINGHAHPLRWDYCRINVSLGDSSMLSSLASGFDGAATNSGVYYPCLE